MQTAFAWTNTYTLQSVTTTASPLHEAEKKPQKNDMACVPTSFHVIGIQEKSPCLHTHTNNTQQVMKLSLNIHGLETKYHTAAH